MKNTISNDEILFVSDSHNVEPWALRFRDEEVNYVWRPQSVTALGAAVCFPLLGPLPDGKYVLEGKEYRMEMHGFAKDCDFEVAERSQSSITYAITEDKRTLAQFPYRFRFRVRYSVTDSTLKTEYGVRNRDDRTMHFSVGGHPRFACPIGGPDAGRFEDYRIDFENPESTENIVKSYGPIGLIERFFSDDHRRLRLDYSLFAKGSFCFHPFNSHRIALGSERSSRSLVVRAATATHLQFWTAVGQPFIAIEPFYGSITSLPSKSIDSDWQGRPGTLHVDPGQEFVCAYYATISR